MSERKIDRRTVLKAAAALAAAGLAPGLLFAQSGSGGRDPRTGQSAKALPGRGEFVIRGATILAMDAGIGDFARGDVHVRDGAIVAVAKEITASTASSIDARGMICMPGFIDTHWHARQHPARHRQGGVGRCARARSADYAAHVGAEPNQVPE